MAALANLLTAGPVVAPVGPAVPVPVTLDDGVKYSGGSSESLTEWLQLINRKATTQHWGDDERRRAAIGSLYGQALTWHDEIGVNIADWTDWVGGLRAAFETQLTESQWQTLVESRSQFATESGSTYVLEKLRICRRRSTPLTEPQMIPFLIRGLYNPVHQSVMMVNPPATITDCLAKLRRLEAISFVPVVLPSNPPSCPQLTPPNSSSDSILQALEALTLQVSLVARNESHPVDSTPTHRIWRRHPHLGTIVLSFPRTDMPESATLVKAMVIFLGNAPILFPAIFNRTFLEMHTPSRRDRSDTLACFKPMTIL